MRWTWPWQRVRKPSPETLKEQEKLDQIVSDDRHIDAITRRTRALAESNHLGEDIRRALRGYR